MGFAIQGQKQLAARHSTSLHPCGPFHFGGTACVLGGSGMGPAKQRPRRPREHRRGRGLLWLVRGEVRVGVPLIASGLDSNPLARQIFVSSKYERQMQTRVAGFIAVVSRLGLSANAMSTAFQFLWRGYGLGRPKPDLCGGLSIRLRFRRMRAVE